MSQRIVKFVWLLICLAHAGCGRRVQTPSGISRLAEAVNSVSRSQLLAEKSRSSLRESAEGDVNPLAALTRLMGASIPTAAFSHASHRPQVPESMPDSSRSRQMVANTRIGTVFGSTVMNEMLEAERPFEEVSKVRLPDVDDLGMRAPPAAPAFAKLGVSPDLCSALDVMNVDKPTPVQQLAIPAVIGRENLVIGAQTGSGKTLAYLLPILHSMKADETATFMRAKPRRPRGIVLVPTRELAIQVYGVAKVLSHHIKLTVDVVTGGASAKGQRSSLSQPRDLLVATPGRLLQLIQGGSVFLGDVRYVVLDEVDTMFEAGFADELDFVLKITTRDMSKDDRAVDPSTASVQHLCVGATHPETALDLYKKYFPGIRQLMVQGSHMMPPSLRQNFVVTNGPEAKVIALRNLLGSPDDDGMPSIGRVVVFCNSIPSAQFVDHTLVEGFYKATNYHGAVPPIQRNANYESFINGETHVLVTTDLAARGLDELDVKHVIQFDFAKDAADYIHRCGRTARAGRKGTVTSFVAKSDRNLVKTIQDAQKQQADIVAAGIEQKRINQMKSRFELNPLAHKSDKAAAAFPTSRAAQGSGAWLNEVQEKAGEATWRGRSGKHRDQRDSRTTSGRRTRDTVSRKPRKKRRGS